MATSSRVVSRKASGNVRARPAKQRTSTEEQMLTAHGRRFGQKHERIMRREMARGAVFNLAHARALQE